MEEQTQNASTGAIEVRSWVIALLLSFFLGAFGAHRFYMGYKGTAITMLVITLCSFVLFYIPLIVTGIWALIDFIRILIGSMKNADGTPLQK